MLKCGITDMNAPEDDDDFSGATSSPSVDEEVANVFTVKSFAVLFGLGLLGVVAQAFDLLIIHGETGVVLVLVLQFVLVVIGITIGLALAPKVGFTSRVVDSIAAGTPLLPAIRLDVKPALSVGFMIGVLIFSVEILTHFGPNWTVEQLLLAVPQRILWGGIAEELITRWGLLSLIVFGLWKVGNADAIRPSDRMIWMGILGVAVLFGMLHLPAIAGDPGIADLAIVISVNGIAAIGFGWLFWRHSLEAAMIAHAFAHVVFISIWLGVLLV